ncbi:MAG: hypothetical protein K8U57_05715 [Planctomycetes bacterium]|nr:hypothetical protein [Planctomycetota bacterium]
MAKFFFGWVAGIVVVFGVAFVATKFVDPANPTLQIAVFAVVVAALSFVVTFSKAWHDVFDKEQERKKKENDSQEKILVTARFAPAGTTEVVVGVELYNNGKVPIHIKRASLIVKANGIELSEEMESLNGEMQETVCGPRGQTISSPVSASNRLIEPYQSAQFHLGCFTECSGDWLLSQPADNIHILVESFLGVVGRVNGKEIHAAITKGIE